MVSGNEGNDSQSVEDSCDDQLCQLAKQHCTIKRECLAARQALDAAMQNSTDEAESVDPVAMNTFTDCMQTLRELDDELVMFLTMDLDTDAGMDQDTAASEEDDYYYEIEDEEPEESSMFGLFDFGDDDEATQEDGAADESDPTSINETTTEADQ